MSVEEVFHLRKDTLVYIIFNPENMNNQIQKIKTANSFKRFGYESIRYQPYADPEKDNGFRLTFMGDFKINRDLYVEKCKWYSFAMILKKIRKETRPVIITFAGNELVQDISNKIETKDFEILGFNLNLNNIRKSQPTSGMYITPLEARTLFKQRLLEKEITGPIDSEMISYYNKNIEDPSQKYQYLTMTNVLF